MQHSRPFAAGIGAIYQGMGEFMVIQGICLLVLMVWPELALWLPRVLQ